MRELETASVLVVALVRGIPPVRRVAGGASCHWVYSFRGCGGSFVRIAAILFFFEIFSKRGLTYCERYCTIMVLVNDTGAND